MHGVTQFGDSAVVVRARIKCRGDFSLEDWGDALNHAENSWNDHTADYLIGTALLGDYLADGLDHFESQDSD